MVIMEIDEAFAKTEEINVYNDGVKFSYVPGEKTFDEILSAWNDMIDGARPMPAFGVSLDKETTDAMRRGLWAEFVFGEPMECDGMPFEKLLVEVEKDFGGFNIIRFTSEYGYEGRCFYIDLVNNDMSNFYSFMMGI